VTYDGAHAIAHGDVLAVLRELPSNEFDACLCDPPYGLAPRKGAKAGFMGCAWDYDVPSVDVWRELLRVLKPGAPLVSFGGTRTFHRVAVGIEDAGFELRDVLSWMYGSGFPKSLDVSKAIDKAAGAEREVVGFKRSGLSMNTQLNDDGWSAIGTGEAGKQTPVTAPSTPLAQQWAGYGTALKPAWESAVMARKPLDINGLALELARTITEAVCQLSSLARDAGKLSASSLSALQPLDSARWDAVAQCNSPGALLDLMATWPSASAMPSCLNTALSWLRILADVSEHASTFTTETESSLTIDLRTLKSSTSAITPESIIQASTGRRGITSIASLAESVFAVVKGRLDLTRITSAGVPATSMAGGEGLLPNWEPAILARKPLDGTVASNVERWGCGGLAIDACRIGDEERFNPPAVGSWTDQGYASRAIDGKTVTGRWPANVIMDEEAGAALDAQAGNRPAGWFSGATRKGLGFGSSSPKDEADGTKPSRSTGDSGGPSRFFYSAKVSTKEREWGCGELAMKSAASMTDSEEGQARLDSPRTGAGRGNGARNFHPTLKPIALTRWLARLLLPPTSNAQLIVPFSGAGSEMIGALQAGWPAVFGIEGEQEYVDIANARIAAWGKGTP